MNFWRRLVSHITDIILTTAIDDGASQDGMHPNVDILNHYLQVNHGSGVLVQVDGRAGGGKAMQCDVFMAALNHLDMPSLLRVFYGIQWEYPESVQLLLKDEHCVKFMVYTPKR